MTRFSFYMRASMRVHKRYMTSNLSFKTIVYAIDVCTAVGRRVHGSWQMCARQLVDACMPVRNAHAKIELRVHANCKQRTAE